MIKKQEVIICPVSRERIQNRKNWYESICFQKDFDIVRMINDYQGNQILFYRNTKPVFLLMGASGMGMKGADISDGQRIMLISGKPKSCKTENVMRRSTKSF